MKYILCLIAAVLVVVLVQSEAKVLRDLDDLTDDDFGVETQLEELGEDEVASEKRGYVKLTRVVLKGLVRLLRRNRSLITKYLKDFYGKGGGKEVDDAIDVIIGVADRLHGADVAFSAYFVDVAANLGLDRGFGLAVYEAIKMIL